VAVDAGVHLSAITRILEETQPPDLGETEELALPYVLRSGPFAGLQVNSSSASANAAYVHRSLIDTYLITHPHLDHISGFVINTAGLPGTRPKRLAGLPSTIQAFKTHIFNNVIWPNLSDENNGAGLVTYMRLNEGGSLALGDGDGKGYLEISDGLAVKMWGVSHGHCIEKHSHRGSGSSSRYPSVDVSSMAMGPIGMGMSISVPVHGTPRALARHNSSATSNLGSFLQQQQHRDQLLLSNSVSGVVPGSTAASGGSHRASSSVVGGPGPSSGSTSTTESACVYDSSAYFLRDVTTGREILIFGDVEPDSISLIPRNQQIWREAAPKIAAGNLAAVFIECSYDDSQTVDRLFGHLAPRFIIEELGVLAAEVGATRMALLHQQELADAQADAARVGPGSDKKKRKRQASESGPGGSGSGSSTVRRKGGSGPQPTHIATSSPAPQPSTDEPVSPKTTVKHTNGSRSGSGSQADGSQPADPFDSPHISSPTAGLSLHDNNLSTPGTPLSVATAVPPVGTSGPLHLPLRGLKVVIIHVKDKPDSIDPAGVTILSQLLEYESEAQFGCEFIISTSGQEFLL
jgi:3',5'-cyclic-nucleotide phosphodiesterase